MADGYPIVLDVRDRLIVIVGGGAVALRKVQVLLNCGAGHIRVVAPSFHAEMPLTGIERITESYRPGHLSGASLVFASTDSPDVNDAVIQDAGKINALVCRADVDEEHAGDFATPAMLRDGPLLITVSSGGSPALSAMIRDRLRLAIDPAWARMAEAMQVLRGTIRTTLPPARRRQIFRELASDSAIERLTQGGMSGLKHWLKETFPDFKESDDDARSDAAD